LKLYNIWWQSDTKNGSQVRWNT